MFDLGAFSVADMVACSSQVRQVTEGAASMEDAARALVHCLRSQFVDPTTRTPSFALVRLYQTVPWDRLPGSLREYVQVHAQLPPARGAVRCLALLGTEGDLPAWCDRSTSRFRQAVALPDRDAVGRVPLLGGVLASLGVDADAVVRGEVVPGRVGAGAGGPGGQVLAGQVLGGAVAGGVEDGGLGEGGGLCFVPDAANSPLVVDQEFVAVHRIASALGFGGVLPSGDVFLCVLFSHTVIPEATAEKFSTVAAAARLALVGFHKAPLFAGESVPFGEAEEAEEARRSALEALLAAAEDTSREQAAAAQAAHGALETRSLELERSEEELRTKQRRLEQESRIIQTLYSVGQQLATELNLDRLIQAAVDAATQIIVAEFGVLFLAGDAGGSRGQRMAVWGAARAEVEAVPGFGEVFAQEASRREPLRVDDIAADAAFAGRALGVVELPGLAPPRSYLAVPVLAADGELVGSFHFVHHLPGIFTARDEQLALGIAAQTATAIGNAVLFGRERDTAVRLQNTLLPSEPPQIDELEVAFRYLPGDKGNQVGGDWFDVIPLAAGRVALVIGDVMGHGLTAAAIMGQLRTAVRAYAVMDLPPAHLMHHLNRLVTGMGIEQLATCVYAVYDPAGGSVRWANAGHLPPAVISPTGQVSLLEDTDGTPLGIDDAVFDESVRELPPGSRLLLYTDGLVESHARPLSERLKTLRSELAGLDGHPEAACDALLSAMLTDPDNPDDVALLLVRTRATTIRSAQVSLPPSVTAARQARVFARETLSAWELGDQVEAVMSVVSELVINSCEHARTPMQVRLHRHPRRVVVEVADRDGRLPRPTTAGPLDERHRGLLIVARLTDRWGVRPTETGKVVWAEINVR